MAGAALSAVSLLTMPGTLQAGEPGPQPNILVLLTDDIGWGDLRCYNPEGKIPTPAFDALAAAGMRFTDAHAPCAVCAPSRYSMVTGNFPWRGRTTTGAWKFDGGSDLLPGQKTFAHLARERGYRTGIFGKTGFGATLEKNSDGKIDWSKPLVDGPAQWGFDFSHILISGHQAAPYFYHRNGVMVGDPARVIDFPRPLASTPETDIRFGGPGLPGWDTRTVGATLLDAFEEFLDQPRDGPFLAFFNTAGAHGPHTPPGEIRGQQVRGASGLHAQADMVVEADVVLGHLISILSKRKRLDNTLIIATSDNGGVPHKWTYEKESGHDPVGGLRGAKSLVWEGGHRVPLIARWGDGTPAGSRIAPGSTSDRLVGINDIYATVAEILGIKSPAGSGLDSVSLLPILEGDKSDDPRPRREAFIATSDFRYNSALSEEDEKPEAPLVAHGVPNPGVARAYREGTWSLLFDKENRAVALHDLSTDLKQTTNLINRPEHKARIADMVERFARQFAPDHAD